jgi:hypothetical protein
LRGEESRGNGGNVIAAVVATFVVTAGKNRAVYFASLQSILYDMQMGACPSKRLEVNKAPSDVIALLWVVMVVGSTIGRNHGHRKIF